MLKRIFVILFTILFSLYANTTAFAVDASQNAAKRYIVKFKTDKIDKKQLISKHNGKLKHEFKYFNAAVADFTEQELSNIKHDKDVDYVEQDSILKISSTYVSNWGVNDIKAPVSWRAGLTGKGVKIAIIDTGVSFHSELIIAGGVNTIIGSNNTSYYDDNGHGTHVAGIIAAQGLNGLKGVAPDASLYSVKALDSTGSGYTSDIIEGIDWAIENGMNLINMSLGSDQSGISLQNALDNAYNKGLLIVAAAGNSGNMDGTGDTVEYPAKYSSAIAVAAVDSTDTRAYFSSTGSKVEVAAPGVNITSTYLNGGYAEMSGTSMAAPFVTGDLALLKQKYPDYSNVQLRQLLDQNVLDLGVTGKDTMYGYGLIVAPNSAASVSEAYIYETEAKALYDLGLFKGVSVSEYNPDLGAAMDRETGIVMILRLVGKIDEADAMTDNEANAVLSKYSDANMIKDWARKPFAYAVKNGMILGVSDTMIGPVQRITGKMFATIILRNIGVQVTSVNYDVATSLMAYMGGLKYSEAEYFKNRYLIRDDMVGMSYGSLKLHYVSTDKTIIETLIDAGKVDRALAVSLGLSS